MPLCVAKADQQPDQLAPLKAASAYSRYELVIKAGWVSNVAEKYRRSVAESCATVRGSDGRRGRQEVVRAQLALIQDAPSSGQSLIIPSTFATNLVHLAGIDDSVRLGGPSCICHSPAEI